MTGTTEVTQVRTRAEKAAVVRRYALKQLLFELGLPLACYYGLRAAGVSQWGALLVGSLLLMPWIGYGMVRRRRIEGMAVFTLVVLVIGSLMTLVTGDPRTLLVRDSWLAGLVGLWVLGTLPTRSPFMLTAFRPLIVAKVGEDGFRQWRAQWEANPLFRRRIRVITAVWGTVLTLDAGVRVVLALTLPVDLVPTVSTVQWLVVLAGLIFFHKWYVTRSGLEA
ncbi:VC0807 family protein [Streptomyces sp. NPDC049555]|uniref:VC0807 family protein n=1 Tax=Streptomyces sp. NPDC049555 TaxID=3154930 RepID=UPI003412C352